MSDDYYAKKKVYFYEICNVPDGELFKKQCLTIEKNIPDLNKEQLLEDVDGTLIQIYRNKQGEIRVYNNYCVYCLYVESDFDLMPYF